MANVRPKKALGQHFLTDLSIADRIAATLDDRRGTPVLEVGPGMGVLTRFLLARGHDVTVAEIDKESVAYLRQYMPELPDDHIIEGDFLQMDLDKVFDTDFCVIGNYPYNISSQIFFKILDYREQVPQVVCMIQKEVAERIAEKPGTKTYGILSVLL
ncbi:MAG: 16S rRNA (adenine(1518)-N(6)/adenine(1519)-N(6))-dimethyltransferase RsmA, partial [Muribaculaceae bacterium]